MSHIDSVEFGSIVIDGQKYHQVLIIGNETIERNQERLEGLFGTTHKVGDWEIEKLVAGHPEMIVVATGFDGALQPEAGFLDAAVEKGISLMVAQTPKAVELYNETVKAGKKVNALIHTTC